VCCLLCERQVPWEQFVDLADWMVGDSFKDLVEINLWIESVEFGGAEQRVDGCCTFASGVRSREEVIFRPSATTVYSFSSYPNGGVSLCGLAASTLASLGRLFWWRAVERIGIAWLFLGMLRDTGN
jgi:hypothetical protein